MRRRYDPQSQRMIFTPSRPNERSREEIAEIDAELTQRANRIGGGYRPIQEEEDEPEAPEEGELQAEQNTVDTEEDSVIMRGTTCRSLTSANTTQKARKPTTFK